MSVVQGVVLPRQAMSMLNRAPAFRERLIQSVQNKPVHANHSPTQIGNVTQTFLGQSGDLVAGLVTLPASYATPEQRSAIEKLNNGVYKGLSLKVDVDLNERQTQEYKRILGGNERMWPKFQALASVVDNNSVPVVHEVSVCPEGAIPDTAITTVSIVASKNAPCIEGNGVFTVKLTLSADMATPVAAAPAAAAAPAPAAAPAGAPVAPAAAPVVEPKPFIADTLASPDGLKDTIIKTHMERAKPSLTAASEPVVREEIGRLFDFFSEREKKTLAALKQVEAADRAKESFMSEYDAKKAKANEARVARLNEIATLSPFGDSIRALVAASEKLPIAERSMQLKHLLAMHTPLPSQPVQQQQQPMRVGITASTEHEASALMRKHMLGGDTSMQPDAKKQVMADMVKFGIDPSIADFTLKMYPNALGVRQ